MQVYFSHSYRDEAINSYFREHFEEEQIPLGADQKTDVWCVAKLERFLGDITGFVSIIPRRASEQDPGAYSAYIGQELTTARRARVPRLLFVDEQVLDRHRLDFPEDAVLFRPDALDEGKARYGAAIRDFRKVLETAYRPPRAPGSKEAALIVADRRVLREAARDVEELLQRAGYAVTRPLGRDPGRGLDDIRMIERLWRAELCVFLLTDQLSDAHIALAMAHAHCIPSLRLLYDADSTDCTPSVSGVIRWSAPDEMLIEFGRQLKSYQEGLVTPTSATSVMKWRVPDDQKWDRQDGPGLVRHIHPEHSFVRDEINRVNGLFHKALGQVNSREESFEVFRLFYEGLQRHRFGYEFELVTGEGGMQDIRTPTNIASHRTATCIDIACLFASFLEAAGQNPLIIVIEGPGFAHALAGYRVRGEPSWESQGIGDLRGAVARRDAVLFEVTGAVESDCPVGAEAREERRDKLLSILDARGAAEQMLKRSDVRLRHYVDVRIFREANQ